MVRSSIDDVEKSNGRMQRMPFLETGRSLGQRFYNYGRHFRTLIFFMLLGGIIVWVVDTWGDAALNWSHEDMDDALTPIVDNGQALHILIPASHAGINLCKTVMGLSILGYSSPTLLGWKGRDSGDSTENQIATKITAALTHLENIEDDDDLVVMVDAYDSWFQLPPQVLRARYFRIIEGADYRMRRRLGRRAVRREEMKQTVVFGASKACEPNEFSSIACYPVPEATTPRDLYGNDTDVLKDGTAKYETFRPRYLDAGFMMGPVGDVRKVLERAQELVDTLPVADAWYEGVSEFSPTNLFGGDVQGIFNRIFGEQAWQREIIRRRYRSWFKKWSPPILPGSVEEHRFKDITNPDFPHESMEPMSGHPREYGINLDFTGSIVSNTAHSRSDHKSVIFNKPDQVQFNNAIEHEDVKCSIRLKSSPTQDILEAPWPEKASSGTSETWRRTKLFGNLCLGNVPVILHHNDVDKTSREKWWPDLWYQPLAKTALGYIPANPEDAGEDTVPKGAFTSSGDWMTFDTLCPAEYSSELFGITA